MKFILVRNSTFNLDFSTAFYLPSLLSQVSVYLLSKIAYILLSTVSECAVLSMVPLACIMAYVFEYATESFHASGQ